MANGNNDNNDNGPETSGFQGPDEFPTMEDIEEERKAIEEERKRREQEKENKEAVKMTRGQFNRLLLGATAALLFGVGVMEAAKKSPTEFSQHVDELWSAVQVDLDAMLALDEDSEEFESKVAEMLKKSGCFLDKLTNNYLSPERFKKRGINILDEELMDLPDDFGKNPDNGEPYKLKKTVAEKLIKANDAMLADNKGPIKLTSAFRTNTHQARLFDELHKEQPVAMAGWSLHETGQAIDVSNWREARPYLKDVGFQWGIKNDYVHFQYGMAISATEPVAWIDAKDMAKAGWRKGKRITEDIAKKAGEYLRYFRD